ncbi:hypothetical protein GCM10011363_32710 [Marivita lacus]|uniref:Short-chain fatty acyl coenzyme A regulators C-terminal domain-containing protein n=1 Tax=Marivita lacus TaxID=1323742 RepID=A0ABQ1KWP2_9RHOB|nr:hypothetical protein GCM10011363_32710 [Marivita lacus]
MRGALDHAPTLVERFLHRHQTHRAMVDQFRRIAAQTMSGIPFFFLRVDRAGNISKRFDATTITLAEEGGACAVWDIQGAFQVPSPLLPQFVKMPDDGRFYTVSRTSDRPSWARACRTAAVSSPSAPTSTRRT